MTEQSLLGRLKELGLERQLQLNDDAWELLSSNPEERPIRLDFERLRTNLKATLYSLRDQPLFRALGCKGGVRPTVWDVTCGLGGDSMLLLLFGCKVISSERHPIPALMLLRAYTNFTHQLKENWTLCLDEEDHSDKAQVIYFDPMYNCPESSALPRKEMRIFREFVGVDQDAVAVAKRLLEKNRRLIIKRPPKSAPLIENPSFEQEGKAVRFDVYLPVL